MLIFAAFLAGGGDAPDLGWLAAARAALRLAAASVCLLGAGFGAVVFYASAQTIIQLDSPDHLRGRIMGIWMIVFSGSVPLGALWTGQAAAVLGRRRRHGARRPLLCVVVGVLVLAIGVLDRDDARIPTRRSEPDAELGDEDRLAELRMPAAYPDPGLTASEHADRPPR